MFIRNAVLFSWGIPCFIMHAGSEDLAPWREDERSRSSARWGGRNLRKRTLTALALPAVLAVFLAAKNGSVRAATTQPTYYTDRVAVLLYHAFDVPKDSPIMVTAAQFDEHLQALKAEGFQFISPEQFKSWKTGKGTIPPNAVLITIDDGMKEIRTVAMPILRKHGAQAIAFVVYRRVDRAANTVTGQDLLEMERNGILVQSHTYDMHYRVIRPSDQADVAAVLVMDESQIRHDLVQAREAHRSLLGYEPDMLAYPYGVYTPAFVRAAQEEGIRFAFTTKSGLVSRSTPDMELPRLNAGIRSMTGKNVVDMILQYVPKPAQAKPAPTPSAYFVGGGLYRSASEASQAAQRFTRLTGHRLYVTRHPTHNGYWVQTGRIPSKHQAQVLARKWARLGIRYVVPAEWTPATPARNDPHNPTGYFVGGGLYHSRTEASRAAQKFARLTGYRMYVANHPTHQGYWVQTGRIARKEHAQYLAQKWARLGIRYVVTASN